MNLDNWKEKIFKIEKKPRQEIASMPNESPRERYKSSPQEVILDSRDFEREGELLGGRIGDARFVKIRDDWGGVFKPHSNYEGQRKKAFISRERAAYLISRFLGFDFVPPTVIKIINGKEGSLQEFVEDAKSGYETGYSDIDQDERVKLEIFDNLIVNEDRHGNNYLVKDGKIFAIDHGYSLDPIDLGKNIYIERVPVGIAEKLRRFVESEDQKGILRDLLVELLGESVADKFIKRVVAFVESTNADLVFDENKFSNLMGGY